MSSSVVDTHRYKGHFFEVLQQMVRAKVGACALIPAGARHHVRNPGTQPLFFLTIYAPPAY